MNEKKREQERRLNELMIEFEKLVKKAILIKICLSFAIGSAASLILSFITHNYAFLFFAIVFFLGGKLAEAYYEKLGPLGESLVNNWKNDDYVKKYKDDE